MRARLPGAAAVTILAAACTSTSTSTTSASTADGPTSPGGTRPAGIRVQLTIDDTRLTGELLDNATARALAEQLPLTLSDHGSVEKVGELPIGLSPAGAPPGADPSVGDMGYYAPWNDFVPTALSGSAPWTAPSTRSPARTASSPSPSSASPRRAAELANTAGARPM